MYSLQLIFTLDEYEMNVASQYFPSFSTNTAGERPAFCAEASEIPGPPNIVQLGKPLAPIQTDVRGLGGRNYSFNCQRG